MLFLLYVWRFIDNLLNATITQAISWYLIKASFLQVNPIKYNGISSGLNLLWKEQGPSSLWRGWSSKFFGYGVQGGCKFGLYEYFKKFYSDLLVDQNKSLIFFLSSASAQVFADVALCPFEAIKVRVQTQPLFAKGLADGFPKVYAAEGLSGYFTPKLNPSFSSLSSHHIFSSEVLTLVCFLAVFTRGFFHFGVVIFHVISRFTYFWFYEFWFLTFFFDTLLSIGRFHDNVFDI